MGNNLRQTRVRQERISKASTIQIGSRLSRHGRIPPEKEDEREHWRAPQTPVAERERLADIPESGSHSPLDSSIHPPVLLTVAQQAFKASSSALRKSAHRHSLRPSPPLLPQSQPQLQSQPYAKSQLPLEPKSQSPQRRAKKPDLFRYVPLYKADKETAQDTFHDRMMTQHTAGRPKASQGKEGEVGEATPSTRATTPFTPLARRSLQNTQHLAQDTKAPIATPHVQPPEERRSYGQLVRPMRCKQVFVSRGISGDSQDVQAARNHRNRHNSVDVVNNLKPLESLITPTLQKRGSCSPVKRRSQVLPLRSASGLAPPQSRRSLPASQPGSFRVLAVVSSSNSTSQQSTALDRPLVSPATPSLGTSSNSHSNLNLNLNLNSTQRSQVVSGPTERENLPEPLATEHNRGDGPGPGQDEPKEEEKAMVDTVAQHRSASRCASRPRLSSWVRVSPPRSSTCAG